MLITVVSTYFLLTCLIPYVRTDYLTHLIELDRARVEPRGEKARRTARVVVLAAGVALRVLVAHLR